MLSYPPVRAVRRREPKENRMHLIVDGFGCDYQQLADPERIRRFLDTYPDTIRMTKITEPSVHVYYGPKPEDWGLSGFVIIAESHISVHTFPDRRHVNIDVFSCMEFDAVEALAEVQRVFLMDKVRTWTLERGLEHLDPGTARQVVEQERESVRQRL